MFVVTTERLAWAKIEWNMLGEDGEPAASRFRMKVNLVPLDRFEQFMVAYSQGATGIKMRGEDAGDALTVRDFIKEVTRDWDEILGPDNKPLPFSAKNLDLVIQVPGFILGWGLSYVAAWNGMGKAREGNSESSLAAGPAAAGKATRPRPRRPSSSAPSASK